ncbi:MAG: phosphotransferase [Acidimicrobiales bacterium]
MTEPHPTAPADDAAVATNLVATALAGLEAEPRDYEVVDVTDAGGGRGVFSRVWRVGLRWARPGLGPASLVVKTPVAGPNGDAARANGAYRREALAYRRLLRQSRVGHPRCYLVQARGDDASFVLEDLADHRAVDQLQGLDADDAGVVVDALGRLHRQWQGQAELDRIDVRRSVPSSIGRQTLEAGLKALDERWADRLPQGTRSAFAALVADADELARRFSEAGPVTLCHGDPRADNLVFAPSGPVVLFDWQQLAIQFGVADVAWLLATSLRPEVRRAAEADLVERYGATATRYRLGLVLPGMAVLALAQRRTDGERTERMVATSLSRIGSAIADHQPLRAGSPRG